MKRFVGKGLAGCTCYDSVGTEQIFANLNISRTDDRHVVENVNTYSRARRKYTGALGEKKKTLCAKKYYIIRYMYQLCVY